MFSLMQFTIEGPGGGTINNPTGRDLSLGQLISVILDTTLLIAGALLLIWLVWGAMQYIFAGGDKEDLAKSRGRMIYAVVGFIIIVMAFTFKNYAIDILQPQTVNLR